MVRFFGKKKYMVVKKMTVDLSVEIAGIKMKNPLMTASGTFGYGRDYADFSPAILGALVINGVTLKPCREIQHLV